MSASPAPSGLVAGLDVLQRALDHLDGVLAAAVASEDPSAPTAPVLRGSLPTPCARWCLDDLLAHLEDSLDAFTEAGSGRVRLSPPPGGGGTTYGRLRRLRVKAGGLVRTWLDADAATVRVGERRIDLSVVARVAALEVAVHAWDIGVATGGDAARVALPEPLATALLPGAVRAASSVAGAFAAPVSVPADVPASVRVLAVLGRSPASGPGPGPGTSRA